MKVVFPSPDSPATIIVKAAPLLATILWRWLGLPRKSVFNIEIIKESGYRTGWQSQLGTRFLKLVEPL